jgi:hypothetical protein
MKFSARGPFRSTQKWQTAGEKYNGAFTKKEKWKAEQNKQSTARCPASA